MTDTSRQSSKSQGVLASLNSSSQDDLSVTDDNCDVLLEHLQATSRSMEASKNDQVRYQFLKSSLAKNEETFVKTCTLDGVCKRGGKFTKLDLNTGPSYSCSPLENVKANEPTQLQTSAVSSAPPASFIDNLEKSFAFTHDARFVKGVSWTGAIVGGLVLLYVMYKVYRYFSPSNPYGAYAPYNGYGGYAGYGLSRPYQPVYAQPVLQPMVQPIIQPMQPMQY